MKTTKSVQRKVDDRPWQREGSHAQPESTSPDPSKGDRTKGSPLTSLRSRTDNRYLIMIRPAVDDPDSIAEAHSAHAFSS